MKGCIKIFSSIYLAGVLVYAFGCKPYHEEAKSGDRDLSYDVPLQNSVENKDIDDPQPLPTGTISKTIDAVPGLPHPQFRPGTDTLRTDISNFEEPKDISMNQGARKPARTGNPDTDVKPICGNDEIELGEQCDDGDDDDEDGCNRKCKLTDRGCSFHSGRGSVYIYCDWNEVTWDEARQACENFGPFYLATINDQAENDLITRFIDEDTWIGLNDIDDEGYFEWLDGEPLDYTNWNDGEPNNDGDEDCGEIYESGFWNDLNCTNELAFVCEAKLHS